MAKKSVILILVVLTTGIVFAAKQPEGGGLLREGFVLNGVEGTIKADKKGVWFFTADTDISDESVVVLAGKAIELLASSTLEKITTTAGDDFSAGVRLWARISRYDGRNFLFAFMFIPLSGFEGTSPQVTIEPNTTQKESTEPAEQMEESIIPPDVMAILKPKRMVDFGKLKETMDIEGDVILANRTGFIVGKKGNRTFEVDGLGRNVDGLRLRLLDCEVLERTEQKLAMTTGRQRYRVAGIVSKYKDDYYLLLQRAVRTYSHGNFTR